MEPALSVGIFALGARFAASDDCSQHPGGCAKNFRRGMRTPKLIWGAQAASLPSPSACRRQTLVSTIRFRKLFGERHGTQACGLCAKRHLSASIRGSGVQLRWAHRPGGLCSDLPKAGWVAAARYQNQRAASELTRGDSSAIEKCRWVASSSGALAPFASAFRGGVIFIPTSLLTPRSSIVTP